MAFRGPGEAGKELEFEAGETDTSSPTFRELAPHHGVACPF